MDMKRMMELAGLEANTLNESAAVEVLEEAFDTEFFLAAQLPDGETIYLQGSDGKRLVVPRKEIKSYLDMLNGGSNNNPVTWYQVSTTEMEAPTRAEDRPGSGYERFSDDTSERDGPDYDDQFGGR
jgi:hypothetical protein